MIGYIVWVWLLLIVLAGRSWRIKTRLAATSIIASKKTCLCLSLVFIDLSYFEMGPKMYHYFMNFNVDRKCVAVELELSLVLLKMPSQKNGVNSWFHRRGLDEGRSTS